MRNIIAAIAAMLATVCRRTWNAATQVWEWSREHVAMPAVHLTGGVFDAAIAAADLALSVPRRILGLGAPGGNAPSESQATAKATQQARAQEAAADAGSDERARLAAMRRVAASRARGERPPQDAVDLAGDAYVRYVAALSEPEARRMAIASTRDLRAILQDGRAPSGVRGPLEIAQEMRSRQFAPAPSVDAIRAARRAEIRAAIRSGGGATLSLGPTAA